MVINKCHNVSVDYSYHNAENLVFEQAEVKELAWLGGIWDGDGSISFQTTRRKNGNLVIVPFLSVTNTDKETIAEIKRILDKIKIGYKESWIVDKANPDHLMRCNIRVDKFARAKALVGMIYPYLKSTKRHNAEVVLEFVKEREENFLTRNENGQIVRNKYPKWLVEKIATVRKHAKAIPLEELLACPNVS